MSAERELQAGSVLSEDEALAVEEVMRERLSELAAENLIQEVDGAIVGAEWCDALHDEVLREGRARHARRPASG